MDVHVNVDPAALFTSIDDEKDPDLNESDDFDSTVKLELEDSIQSNLSDSGTEDDDSVYRFDKKSASYGSARRFFNKSSVKTWKGNRKSISEDSKEFFTLQFDDDDKEMNIVERVPAKKGKSLKESIESLFIDRNIDFSTHSVFVESSKTPLPLAFDTFPLGGNLLHVKENESMQVDERIITLMKSADDDKKVQNQRPKKNIMPSIFNDTVEVSTTTNKHQALARKSGVSTGVSKDENRSLSDLLSNYTFNYFDTENDVDGYENSLNDTYLEESWTDIITEYEGMTNKDKIQQETIWELLVTERNYLRKIRVIIMVFKNCLVSIQKENFLEDIDIDKLFANIKEVYNTNHKFWENHLRHVTEEARATKKPIKPSQLNESFASFEELFQPYIRYCMEEGSCVKYLKQLKRENEMFQEYLAWCENHRQCMRLKLADLFVKPMQRVTKYSLLLKAILNKTTDEDERNALENMILEVDRFVTKINTTLRLRNEQQKLDDVLERIDMYNPIEAANEEMEKLLENYYCNFDLHGNIPGLHEEEQRCILLEGPMKMIEKQGRGDVHTFLFTDVIVLAKAKKGSDKFRIIRQPFRLNKVMLHRSKDVGAFIVIYLNEYDVVVTAFTLQCTVANEQKKWVNAIQRAKKRYEDARAARGSTLAFFDDDLPSASAFVTSFSSSASPMPDRRSIISDDNRSLDQASMTRDDIRCQSMEAVTQAYQKPEDLTSESHVKRSFSDPKAGISSSRRERSSSKQKGRPRPKSLVNISDHDIATWVLTNENRNQSGSLTSDISDDSQRSSGIGDSFRSINSDGGIIIPFANLPELSKVAQLKAHFENNGCNSPVNTDGSDSSVSTPSILGLPETSPALPGCRRISPPDYMDNHLTIKEEEEQSTNNITTVLTSIADSDKDTENDSSESLRTLNDRSLSNHSYKHTTSFVKMPPLKLTYVSTASQTEHPLSMCVLESNSSLHDIRDSGVQCELLLDNLQSEHLKNDLQSKSLCKCLDLGTSNSEIMAEKLMSADVPNILPSFNIVEDCTLINVSEQVGASNILENLSDVSENLGADTSENVTSTDIDFCVDLTSVDHSENTEKIGLSENLCTNICRKLSDGDVCQNSMFNDKAENLSLTPCKVAEFVRLAFVHISTQCDEKSIKQELTPNHCRASLFISQSTMTEEFKEYNDMATQYEVLCNIMKDTATQCGDFIQLVAKDEETCATESIRKPIRTRSNFNVNICCMPKSPQVCQKSLSDDGCGSKSKSPFMDTLMQSDRPHSALTYRKPMGILKHSYSEANMGNALNRPISHSRSQSDEPQQKSFPNSPENRHRNNSTPQEFPGMYALQTLSESLESSVQNRLLSNSKPTVKDCGDGCDTKVDKPEIKSNNLNKEILIRCNSNSSTSLRKLAIMNSSPLPSRKEPSDVDQEEEAEIDFFNENYGPTSQSSPKLRNKIHVDETCNKKVEGNKRFTWHDFDSLAALNRIEEAKYGHSMPNRAATLPLNKTISKSSEIISSSKKSSLKRSIIRRFTDVLNRSDEPRSSLDHSNTTKEGVTDKSLKKTQKKERKRLKKEKRVKEKEEKKRESVVSKGRSASVSSGNSRFSFTPLSSSNSYGSHMSSMNSR